MCKCFFVICLQKPSASAEQAALMHGQTFSLNVWKSLWHIKIATPKGVAILYQALRKGTYLKVLRHGGVDNVRAFLKG